MLVLGLVEDHDVIEVHENKVVEHVSQYIVDKGLKDGKGIGEAEQHCKVLIVPDRVLNAVFHSSPSLMQTRW